MNRRDLLAACVGLGGAVAAAVVAVPAVLAALTPAVRPRRSERWRPVGRLDRFPVDRVEKAEVEIGDEERLGPLAVKAVFVWRRSDDGLVVFSRNCTDLSCPITFDHGSECFFCPCHGGIFAKDGTPMAGPPSVPLYRYASRVRDGVVEIDLDSLPPMT